MDKQKTRGMAGTIMVIMVLGLLISISTAYIKMVQTETQVQGMIDNSDRALDAAFSGVNFVMAVAQGQKILFDAALVTNRYYFTRTIPLPGDWYAIGTATFVAANYPNATGSDWFYLNESLDLFDYGDTGSSTKPYHFRAISYPAIVAGAIQPGSYTIKAQGRFLVYDSTLTNVLATYTSQIIAECEINFPRKVIQLKRWRYMPFETDTNFFEAASY